MKQTALLIIALFAFANILAQDCNLNEEAHRHIVRAKGYMGAAEKDEDYLDVFNEYKKAFEYAPNCPDICYNLAHCAEILCKINTQNCDVAIYWYKKYLEINPNASDKNEIRDKIYEAEVKKEIYAKKEKENALKELEKWIGKWEWSTSIENVGGFEIYLTNGKLKAKMIKKWNSNEKSHYWVSEYQEVPVSIDNNVMTFTYVWRLDSYERGSLKYWNEYHNKKVCRLISTEKMEIENHYVIYSSRTKVNEGISTDFFYKN